ncbi:LysM peptidoglycan-binding domain-containing protein [Plantactinospora siamensis]|uniref:LysM peptidoglycan-binding domain-containing protein n=1 Tax=Plantactinospora siamensis TaxID=555372 RepID=A0ABV6NRE5_9ACTN
MAPSGSPARRRAGQVLTGLGALVVLAALLGGAPIALLTLAGDPLPDHVPTLTELGATLTSRDDGELFLRTLAILGWAGWATFTLSVLVELPARLLRRPAPRLPGMGRQQRAAAALVGSVALILAASPAAAMAATVAAQPAIAAAPAQPAGPPGVSGLGQAGLGHVAAGLPHVQPATGYQTRLADAHDPRSVTGRAVVSRPAGAATPPVYRVAHGDYLGRIAERYLGDFRRYPEISRLNELRDPDRIAAGQQLRLPRDAVDRGQRPHANGRLIGPAAARGGTAPAPRRNPARPTTPARPPVPSRSASGARSSTGVSDASSGRDTPALSAGAARAERLGALNRPLAVSAVLTVAALVGAQIGAMLGLRRPAGHPGPAAGPPGGSTGQTGRHRRFHG